MSQSLRARLVLAQYRRRPTAAGYFWPAYLGFLALVLWVLA